MSQQQGLTKSLSLGTAIGLAITMVVGSGLLVLPGLAYARVGAAAIYAWLISALAVGPILIIFARLGARFPNAGGVTGFLQAAFGRPAGVGAEILVLGAIPGGAAIAITGGQYFAALLDGSQSALLAGTLIVLGVGGAVNLPGARLSGKVQQILAGVLIALLALVAVCAFAFGHHSGTIAAPQAWPQAMPAFGLVFFAFVGWELMAFTSEEFQNPRRDFPLMMAASYGVVVVLYALIAGATQWLFQPEDPLLLRAPLAAMLALVLGPASGKAVAALGFLLVLANFISVVWAFSRLIFSSAREGLLSAPIARVNSRGVPARAVLLVTAIFSLFTLACWLKLITHSLLFELAGVSFFCSYLLAIAAYARMADTMRQKALAAAALCLTLGFYLSFGPLGLYGAVLFALGLWLGKAKAPPPQPAHKK